MNPPEDLTEGRIGPWMHTSTGGRWYPQDPRDEELRITDLANGNSLDCRYAGQGRVDRFYSVAEHQVLGAQWVLNNHAACWLDFNEGCIVAFLFLIHDAPEGFYRDLNRATKLTIGEPYKRLEREVWRMLLERYGLRGSFLKHEALLKEIDCRMIPTEKAAIMRYPQPWAFDQFEPLPDLKIQCWNPVEAKMRWTEMYLFLCDSTGRKPEEVEI